MVESRTNRRKNRITLFTFMALLVAVIYLTFRVCAPYLLAVFMGGILALIARPVYQRLLVKMRPKVAAMLITGAITLLLIGPFLVCAALAVDQAIDVANELSKSEGFSLPYISRKLSQFKPIRTIIGDADALDAQLKSSIQSAGKAVSTWLLAFISLLPDFVLQLILGLFACYFMLTDGKRFFTWLKDKMPLDNDIRERIYGSFKESAVSTIWASMTAATCQTTIMFLAYLLLGMPIAFLAAGATFFLAWVPIVGSTPVWLGGAIYLYAKGSVWKAVAMLGAGALTGVSDNIVYPMVLKGKANLHPLVGLVAVFGGVQMFGILGVFIGPILASMVIALLNVWPEVRKRFALGEPAELAADAGTRNAKG